MDPVAVLLRCDGVARWRDLIDAGVSTQRLRLAVAEGLIIRPHRGCYALPAARYEEIDATILRGVPCCVTALLAAEIPVIPWPDRTHIAIPDSRSLARPGIRPLERMVAHRSLRYPLRTMRLPAVALDVASQCLEPAAQLASIEGAVRAGIVRPDVIDGFRMTSKARQEWLTRRMDLTSESPPETLVRVVLRDAGLDVRTQVHFPEIGRVDFVVNGAVVVECDGRTYHSDAEAFQHDRDRDRWLAIQGWPVLRFTYLDALLRPNVIVNDVRAVLWRQSAA